MGPRSRTYAAAATSVIPLAGGAMRAVLPPPERQRRACAGPLEQPLRRARVK